MLPLEAVTTIGRYLPAGKVLCLGYPTIQCSVDELKTAWGIDEMIPFSNGGVPETISALRIAGCASVTVVDVVQHTGLEVLYDLNGTTPIPGGPGNALGNAPDNARYDLIIDPGTMEHCFNIGQAFRHVLEALAVGGVVYHIGPVSMVNHGFWNVCPTALFDFYEQNGCEVDLYRIVAPGDEDWLDLLASAALKRVKCAPEYTYRCVVRKISEVPANEFRWPIQSKYKTAPIPLDEAAA